MMCINLLNDSYQIIETENFPQPAFVTHKCNKRFICHEPGRRNTLLLTAIFVSTRILTIFHTYFLRCFTLIWYWDQQNSGRTRLALHNLQSFFITTPGFCCHQLHSIIPPLFRILRKTVPYYYAIFFQLFILHCIKITLLI